MAFKIVALLLAASSTQHLTSRIHSNIDDTQTFTLKGNTRPAIAQGRARDQGAVDPSLVMPRMSIHFAPTAAQQADLDQFLVAVQDRRSPSFHKFLTPEQYAERFGVSDSDLAKVTIWLENNGFSKIEAERGRGSISFNGTAAQAQSAFHTNIHNYVLDGETNFSNTSDPELPQALQSLVMHIEGLNNFRLKPSAQLRPNYTSSSTGNTFMTPNDWATIYNVKPLYGAGWDGSPISTAGTACGGSPCSIAVIGQSDVQASDLAAFRSAAGLPAKAVTVLIPPTDSDPGVRTGDEGESDLDLEWANGIAPNANVLFVTANGGVSVAMAYAINNNVAPVVTISYSLCEASAGTTLINARNLLYQQANAQGMTIVASSGDSGAAGCDAHGSTAPYPASKGLAVGFPAASPYVTGVGGTTLTVANTTSGGYWSSTNDSGFGSAVTYIPETVWNDSATVGYLSTGGGGASAFAAKPSWQVGTGVPADGRRDVPDLALAASSHQNGYIICGHSWCVNQFRSANSTLDVIGGTSASTPSFAGVLALLVQKMGTPLGNINPNLYTLAQAAPSVYHDITSGSNIVACTVGTTNCSSGSLGYSAGVGYDQASGLGSIDAFNFVEYWSADIQITAAPTSVSVQAGSSSTANVTVAPLRGFTGPVSFACSVSSSLVGVTCSVPSSAVDTSGTVPLTLNATSSASTPWWRKLKDMPPSSPGLLALLTLLLVATAICITRKKQLIYACGVAALLLATFGSVSCGCPSCSSVTPAHVAESGTVLVTATSGTIRNQVVLAVSVP